MTQSNETLPTPPLVESTTATYNDRALPTSTSTSDGQTNFLRYYADDNTEDANRSDQLPNISALIAGLHLIDGTPLSTAADLQCPQLIDTWHPPLMARLEYLAFEGMATSAATLTLCGYARSTRDAQGRLMPDTVLVLEGITVTGTEGAAKNWTVSLAPSWSAVKFTLSQNKTDIVKDALLSTTRTVTTWYKDDSARSTQQTTEMTLQGGQAGTFKLITKAVKIAGDDAILSQQIVSAFSGRVLRESHQDSDGNPMRFTCHEYDIRGRGTRSTTYAYGDGTAFNTGSVIELEPLEDQQVTWTDTGFGTWVSTTRSDGRQQRTLYDGMQRAVRRELQREAGSSEYILLEQSVWESGQAPEQVINHDYLPGGLCVHDDKSAALPSQGRHYFWQAHSEPVVTQNGDKEQTLASESALGVLGSGIQYVQKHRQVNHLTGAVTLSFARWSGSDSSDETKAFRTEEVIDGRGRQIMFKQHVPLEGSTFKSREWTTRWDDLDRPTVIIQPDQSEVRWSYQGLDSVPERVSVKAKDGTEKVLGTQTFQNGTVLDQVVGGIHGLAYHDQAGAITSPDGKTLYSTETESSASWYVRDKNSKDSKGRLLASFEYNAITRAFKAERTTEGVQQSRVTSEGLNPLLLGSWRFERTVHAQRQRQEALVSLRGEVQRMRHANGISSEGWSSPHSQAHRVRRGSLEYWYEYTAQGQCERMTVRDLNSGRCMAVSYSYDALGNEIERSYRLDDQTKTRYVQTWSSIGQLLSKTLYRDGSATAARTETFTYYTSVNGKRDELQGWTVDATTGNEITDADGYALKEQQYKYNELGSLTECRTLRTDGNTQVVAYAYTSADHPTRRTQQATHFIPAKGSPGAKKTQVLTYDANGQLTCNEQGHTLAYTDTGRLRSIITADQSTPLTYYEYDERDRLISQWDATLQQYRVLAYSGEVQCAETWLDKDRKVTRTLTLDEHAGAVVNNQESTAEIQLFVLSDPQHAGGDEYWVDANGIWQHRSIAFTPWGEAPLAKLTQMQSGLSHNGHRVDPVTGCYHLGNGYRVYDPRHRAFYQRDSWSPFGEGGLNDRAYCAGGDPVNWHDPSGHIMLSRRDQGASLARLDRAIAATTPPVREAAPWWQWGLLAVFAVISVAVTIATFGSAGPIMAGIGMALCTAIMVGTAVTAAGMALRQSNPRLSTRLEGAGHIVTGLASLPGMAASLPAIVGGIVVTTTLVALSLESARLAVMQDNPELAEKLGWASTTIGLAGMAASLPSLGRGLAHAGNNALQKIRGLRYSITSRVTVPVARGKPEVLSGTISKTQRDALNASRPATPPSTPIRAGRARGNYPLQEHDIGDFIVYRRAANPSDRLIISAHGGNTIRGGKVSIPPNSQLNHYAPSTGTISTPIDRDVTKLKILGVTYKTIKGPVRADIGLSRLAEGKGVVSPSKIVPGNHFTSNYALSHFEDSVTSQIRQLVETYAVDIAVVKQHTKGSTLAKLFSELDDAGLKYKVYEGLFCRASELKNSFFLPLPNRSIIPT